MAHLTLKRIDRAITGVFHCTRRGLNEWLASRLPTSLSRRSPLPRVPPKASDVMGGAAGRANGDWAEEVTTYLRIDMQHRTLRAGVTHSYMAPGTVVADQDDRTIAGLHIPGSGPLYSLLSVLQLVAGIVALVAPYKVEMKGMRGWAWDGMWFQQKAAALACGGTREVVHC